MMPAAFDEAVQEAADTVEEAAGPIESCRRTARRGRLIQPFTARRRSPI